ncbi:COG1470 family protein [Micromonospora fluostatini]|uniref:COG1470 family protein n=1 Tax=Micromonospora sp. JCM 30529 TaxID=3421643 RepID=UPI003D1709DE
MRASANLGSTAVSVAPGGEAEVPVTVRNAGDTVEAYQIEILGVPDEWVTVEPPTLTLYPAGSDTVVVTFRPPRSSRVDAGNRTFGVRVVPAEYPDSALVEEGVLTVEPFYEVAAQVQPPSRSAVRTARYRIDTDNLGNVTEQVSFAVAEGTDQVTFTLPAAPVAVPNGTRAETRLRVRARRLLWWGEPKQYPFTVELTPGDGRVRTLDAIFVQRPVISAGLLKLLAALLALLLVLLALWFGLLRPQVETAAREAVEAENARRVAQDGPQPPSPEPVPPAASPEAPGGAPGAGDGQGTDGGVGPGGVGGPAGGLGGEQFSVAITFRTSPNGSAERSYTVPEGRTFLLTDFLVDNVQGDEGTLTVTANGVRVVTYALENFRNQDYHSVTPIRVPERARVTLTVVCRRAGQPANAPRATTCRESLYLNGVLTAPPTTPPAGD